MSDPMTLEETIAEARELAEMTNGRFERSMLHWLTTLNTECQHAAEGQLELARKTSAIMAERDRLAEQLDKAELSEAKYMKMAGRYAEQNRKLRSALEDMRTPMTDERIDALLAETEPSDG